MYRCSAFVWRTILRKHSACSLGTHLSPWHCLNIVPETHSEPQTCQCGHVSPHHSPYIDMLCSLPWEIWHGDLSLTDGQFPQFPPNKLSLLWNHLANPMCLKLVCALYEWHVLDFIISQKSFLCSPFRHTSRDNIARVQSQRAWQTWTCTPRLQLPSKLCLMRLDLTEEFLQTFFCPLFSLHLKWLLWIRYWCVVLICYRFW